MISTKELRKFYTMDDYKDQARLVEVVRSEWCRFADSRGRCNRRCSVNPFCAYNLAMAFEVDASTARNFFGVMVFRLRRQKARAGERLAAAEHEPIELNIFGEAITGNAFERFRQTLGD